MKSNYLLLLFAFFSFYMGCNQYDDQQLIGHWQGIQVFEKGEKMKLNPSEIELVFDKKGFYHYKGTVGYEEAGTYYLEGDLLLSKDTINSNSKQKAVKIIKLKEDSLKIEMQAYGKEQLVLLVKR